MGIGETLLDLFLLGSVPAYPVLQIFAWVHLIGGWRLAGSIPLIVMSPAVLISAVMFLQGSNLWPMFLIIASPVATTYLVIVLLLAERSRRAEQCC